VLSSPFLEPFPSRADLFWIYGCPNGDVILPKLFWVKHAAGSFWNVSVAAGTRAHHVIAIPHEEGWAEVRSSANSLRSNKNSIIQRFKC
jgi:hypothetical protein